jgi:hypothetical protein
MKVGDLIRFVEGFPDDWSGVVGLVIDKRGLEILVSRGSTHRWMRQDAAQVINESR